ncbi:MAG TPA: glycosyltransferase family 2 protein, partial [Candidatus Limnocylindria bacterium]|nr:glycosyltransferase family 2 protein [Candidatus Limnocylindria bacterium]
MKLIVTIPAYNEEETIERAIGEVPRTIPGIDKIEVLVCDDGSTDRTAEVARRAGADHIVRLRRNFGLTIAFGTALQSAVERGADIIVNFDADCQYVGAEIATLVAPILRGEADMVSGDRGVPGLEHMSASKKYGNRIGSYMLRTVAGSGVRDASSGFRAFSRECALRLNPYIGHTYTHQTLIQARHNGMVVKEVPVTFRPSARPNGGSRLISGVAGHVLKSGGTIIRTMTTYRPLSILGGLGLLLVVAGGLVGLIPIINWLQQGNTEGHLQSLIASVVLLLMGLQLLVLALLADVVSANRRLTEEVLYRLRAGKEPDSAIVPPLEESLPVQPAA